MFLSLLRAGNNGKKQKSGVTRKCRTSAVSLNQRLKLEACGAPQAFRLRPAKTGRRGLAQQRPKPAPVQFYRF